MTSANASHWPVHRFPAPLEHDVLAEAQDLLRAAEAADGTPTVSEQSVIALRTGGNPGQQVSVHALFAPEDPFTEEDKPLESLLAGFAVLVGEGGESVLEMAVHPSYRNLGAGLRLAQDVLDARGTLDGVQAWSHGDSAAAEDLARHFGLSKARELWRMRLSTPAAATADDDALPAGYTIRTFVPGQDEEAWLAANAEVFASHPEQGALTLNDLQERLAEPWFDPAGFFLAVDAEDRIAGFHWTKMHPALPGHAAHGEVYVVGVLPHAQGKGLGKVLTRHGVKHLLSRGASTVVLYTEADNAPAVRLYEGLGFTHWDSDVMYRKNPAD
ncbi:MULTISPECIES: mycothiol synthase [Arthrobacter]|uniref:Mycothiol acetyltransferase n=2 Tax=Arthrobacter TaxID=1663 RepID=A0ABU9KMN7_9MICC|nr:mycothiol synthase [Arthrobacter sp. YJM1]MDP5227916.1 mycothiol synthase [Arthrobacter sp. YJM1]